MAIRIALHHRTEYRFDQEVRLAPHAVRLRPAPHCRTRVTGYSLTVEPASHFLNWQQDPQGNHVARLVFPEPTRRLVLEVDLVAELVAINAFDFFLEPEVERFPFAYDPVLAAELAPYLSTPEQMGGPAVEAFCADFRRRGMVAAGVRSIDLLVALNDAVHEAVAYVIRMEPGVQTPAETLARGTGSCRDSAWLLVSLARRLGLAARFCSGYLVQLVPDQKPLDGPAGPATDFTDLHAWAEIYLPGAGWVGFDPTSGLLAAEGHIPLAATPDPASAAPVTGAVDRCASEFNFEMRLTRLAESPRTTRPVSESQWERILMVGDDVDAALAAGDGIRRPRGAASGARPGSWLAACSIAWPLGACSWKGRGSGIPASRCHAGRSMSCGEATASRSGAGGNSWPTIRRSCPRNRSPPSRRGRRPV